MLVSVLFCRSFMDSLSLCISDLSGDINTYFREIFIAGNVLYPERSAIQIVEKLHLFKYKIYKVQFMKFRGKFCRGRLFNRSEGRKRHYDLKISLE